MIKVIDKDDWSGEQVSVRINQKKQSFSFYAGSFFLAPVRDSEVGFFLILEKGCADKIGSVFEDKNQWVAISNNLSREAPTAIEAAVKLICNLR